MAKIKELRSLIYGKYDTEVEFAKTLGWTRQRLNKITNGEKEPDISEIDVMSRALNTDFMTVANIFLLKAPPNGQHESA